MLFIYTGKLSNVIFKRPFRMVLVEVTIFCSLATLAGTTMIIIQISAVIIVTGTTSNISSCSVFETV